MEKRESFPPSETEKQYPEEYSSTLEQILEFGEKSIVTKSIIEAAQGYVNGESDIGGLKGRGWTKQDAQDFLADYQAAIKNQK